WVKGAPKKKELYAKNPGWVSPPAFACGVYPQAAFPRSEQAIALAAMFTCFLAPTAWVLAHVEHYKSRGD
uniref:Uncharacterized protein n=1 Tax=Anas platyrhynchos TaxID=8839 RepID=A0A8B9R567_ANAPL